MMELSCGNDGVRNYVDLLTSGTPQYLWDRCMCHGTLPFLHLKTWDNYFFGVFRNFLSKSKTSLILACL